LSFLSVPHGHPTPPLYFCDGELFVSLDPTPLAEQESPRAAEREEQKRAAGCR
jgi:hypothetical protein